MNYNVTIKSVPSYKIISLRDNIPAYDAEGMLWERLGKYMDEKKIPSRNICYATYHDEGYIEGSVDVEVVMVVENLLDDSDGFIFKESEPIEKAASILVPGEYKTLASAYNFLGKYLEENGYTIIGNTRQLPIKGPWNETNPKDYLTEIQIPIKIVNI